MVRECRPPARVPARSWLTRRSTMATSTRARASSAANIRRVGPPPSIPLPPLARAPPPPPSAARRPPPRGIPLARFFPRLLRLVSGGAPPLLVLAPLFPPPLVPLEPAPPLLLPLEFELLLAPLPLLL